MALCHPRSGQVFVDGEDIVKREPADLADKIGYVFQNPDLQILEDTVFDEVAYGPRAKKLTEATIERQVNEALEAMGLTELKGEYPRLLSFGQKRRLGVAAALALNPRTLILDEITNGQDALEKVEEASPHIILSDVLMPRMSGIELVKQLKGNLDTCHIPVVLLTARTEIEQNLEGLKIGADDYITKPFDSRLLVFRCNNLVNNRRKLQEYFTKQPTVETPVLATNPLDKEFLDEVIAVFEQHLDDSDFTIDMLAQQMLVSRTRMYAKIKAITGQTPNDFFITLRLKKAAFLLRNNPELNVTQISDQTGFSSPRYFSKLFKKAYQLTPMAYRQGEE